MSSGNGDESGVVLSCEILLLVCKCMPTVGPGHAPALQE